MNITFKKKLICVSLTAAILIAYLPVLGSDFINLDDNEYVTENTIVKKGLTIDGLKWAFTTGHSNNWHPITWLSHMLDCAFFGDDPGMHHMTNLLFHILNTLLLLFFLHYATGSFWTAVLVSALFALHPLHVESVAWVSERKDVLSSFFFLLTLIAYVRYAKQRSIISYTAMLCLYALGLMSKPMLVTLPFVLLLLDYWPLERLQAPTMRGSFIKLTLEKIPLFALSLASCVVTFIVQKKGGAVRSVDLIGVADRISNSIISYRDYLFKMAVPKDLSLMYPYSFESLTAANIFFAVLVLVVVTATALLFSKRRYLLVGWLWYLGMLVPVIGLVQVGTQSMADRYTYLPSIGIFIIISCLLSELSQKKPGLKPLIIVSSIGTIVLAGYGSYVQAGYWKDSGTLYQHTIKYAENSSLINFNYGSFKYEKGDIDGAIYYFKKTVERTPHADAYNSLGRCMNQKNKPDEAIGFYLKAIQQSPSYASAHYNVAVLYYEKKQYASAVLHFKEAIRFAPEITDAYNYLAWILATTNDQQIRKPAKAIEFALKACEFSMFKDIGAIDTLAVAYASVGRFEEAVKTAKKALDMAQVSNQTDLIEEISLHLALFEAGKPYIEP